jgi:ECM component-binding autotransporter adhesin
MVLKRLLATALGALGLGALAAGTATAQQIPAPDIFDDQIACSRNVPGALATPTPSVVPMGAMKSALDALIGDGTPVIDVSGTGAGSYEELGYVIDAMVANCGGASVTPGSTATPDTTAFADTTGDDAVGSIPTDVAEGYTDLLTKFVAVYGDPGNNGSTGAKGVLDAANTALAMGITGDNPAMGAALTALQTAVTRAEEAYNKALATFNAANMGPINQAGAAEWMAKAAVTKSVVDYNTQVGKTNEALAALNDTAYVEAPAADDTAGASKWVPLGNTELFDAANATTVVSIDAMGMGTVNLDQLIQYANGNLATPQVGMAGMAGTGTGDGSDGNDAAVASDVAASNFDAAGNLIIPMSVDPDNAAALVPTTSATNTIAAIRTIVDNSRIAAVALKKAADENVGLNQAIYDEAYRRAQLEADYYAARWAEVLADNTDQRTAQQKLEFEDDDGSGFNEADETTENNDYVKDPISIAARNVAYTTESNKRVAAEADLRAKVAAREAATAAVREAFTSPQGFYNQLVVRRTALKAAADKVVADATTPTAAQTKEAEDAAKALMDAVDARDNLVGLFEDENDPAVDLIGELLKGDAEGDDGGALVKAISSNYDTAKAANDKATQVAEDVAGLIGDDGQVGQNTADIKMNTDNITKLDGRVAMNEAEIWDADGNSRIDANEMRSMENATNIATNATNIATNAENIMGLRTDVDSNTGRIMQNETDIMTNAGNISTNSGRLDAAEAAIVEGAGLIAGNTASIGENRSSIMRNADMIGGLQDQMEIVRAGVAASMALAGMPAINGRGISIGVGSFDGESAFAVGFQIQSDMASFKVGVTSAGGETGASAGVGFQF